MMKGVEVSGNDHNYHLMLQQQQQPLQGNKQSQSLPVSNGNHHSFQSNGPYCRFPDAGAVSGKRTGFPPTSPYSQFPSPADAVHPRSGSMSQPPFFSPDVPPPFNPSPSPIHHGNSGSTTFASGSLSVSADSSRSPPPPSKNAGVAGLPPRTAHRRSQSDVPFAFFQSSPQVPAAAPPPHRQGGGFVLSSSAKPPPLGGTPGHSWERGVDIGNGAAGDDLFNAYMNLDGFDAMNSSEHNREGMDSGSKTNGADSSESEADSKSNDGPLVLWANQRFPPENMEGGKRSAAGDLVQLSNPVARHCRSLSTDSYMGKLSFAEESLKLLLPSPGAKGDSDGCGVNSFSLEFANGEFSPAEMKKIMASEKLVEMAMSDPKRVKRILANRQSAARSKERKMRYVVELEHKVKALQTEATTLSSQVALLQRNSVGLTNQNNELRFRLQAMEQQAQLIDALNEALTAEVERMKLAVWGAADSHTSNNLNEPAQGNPQMFQMQQSSQSSSAQVEEPTK